MPYEDGTFAEMLGQQFRFRVLHHGATSVNDVRPDSLAAREIWDRPSTQQFAQGVLDIANGISGPPTPLRGFTLSTSRAGYVANRAIHHFRGSTPTEETYREGLRMARAHTRDTAAVRKGSWLHLGWDRSYGLRAKLLRPSLELEQMTPRRQAALGRGVKTLGHELNHISSPIPAGAEAQDWLSEGSAEVLSRWPGRVEAMGAQLGMRTPTGVGELFDQAQRPYQPEVNAVRGILALSGIDHTKPADYAAAEQLLNEIPEDRLPAHLARVIAEHHGADAAAEARLLRALSGAIAPDGSHALPDAVDQLERALRGSGT
jgi:hypothetical protein